MTYPTFEIFTNRDEKTYKLPVNVYSVKRVVLVLGDHEVVIIKVNTDIVLDHFSDLLRTQAIPVMFSFWKTMREINFYPKPDGKYKILVEYIEECKACHGNGYADHFADLS